MTAPADGGDDTPKTAAWTAASGAVSYTVVVASDAGCSTAETTVANVTALQYGLTGLAFGRHYLCVTAVSAGKTTVASNNGQPFVHYQAVALPAQQNEVGGGGSPVNSALSGEFVLFQSDWTGNGANRSGSIGASGVANPYSLGIFADPNDPTTPNRLKLFVVDRGNNRVLIFNRVPRDGSAVPDVVVGQATFATGAANSGRGAAVDGDGFNAPVGVSVCADGRMLVADASNNRVLVFNHVPTANGAMADYAIGQATLQAFAAGNGQSGLTKPYAGYCLTPQGRLAVLDRGNARVLVYEEDGTHHLPSAAAPAPAAKYVLGQPNFTTYGNACTALSPLGALSGYEAVFDQAGGAYIADAAFGTSNRVVYLPAFPTTSNASLVLGQDPAAPCAGANRGQASAAAGSLNLANSLALQNNVLAVSDNSNYRVLFYDFRVTPLASGQNATDVLGQADFVSKTLASPPTHAASLTTIATTKGLIYDHGYVWIGDSGNNRIVVLKLPY